MDIVQPLIGVVYSCHRNRYQERLHRACNLIRGTSFNNYIQTKLEIGKLGNAVLASRCCSDRSGIALIRFNRILGVVQVCIDCNLCLAIRTVIVIPERGTVHNLINAERCTFQWCSTIGEVIYIVLFTSAVRLYLAIVLILMNRNGTGILRPNILWWCCRRCFTVVRCHCWHSAQAEGQSGAQQACEKTFCFFHFSTSSLKKIIIGWAAGPPGLRVLHQHGVQCGALQRGNAAALPALCREEKRRKNWAACPLGLRCI